MRRSGLPVHEQGLFEDKRALALFLLAALTVFQVLGELRLERIERRVAVPDGRGDIPGRGRCRVYEGKAHDKGQERKKNSAHDERSSLTKLFVTP